MFVAQLRRLPLALFTAMSFLYSENFDGETI